MEIINEIRRKFQQNRFEFSKHAVDNMIIRRITVKEVREVIGSGEVIEDYPQDKYGPSCLVLGFTSENRPLHVQCSYPTRLLVKVVTVYEPDPNEWIDFKVRIT
jgi:hypothetical protein